MVLRVLQVVPQAWVTRVPTPPAFDEIWFGVSVVIMCMSSLLIGGEDQRQLLLDALEMGLVSDGYVFIPYDALLYAMPYQVTRNTLTFISHLDFLCSHEVLFFHSHPIRTQYFLS